MAGQGVPDGVDARTTPRWLRVPVLVGLAVVSLWFLACFHYALRPDMPRWVPFGLWQMFTRKGGPTHVDLEAEALRGGEWQVVDLPELFPTWWESGHRWDVGVRGVKYRLRILADSTCRRMGEPAEKVRLYEVRWPVVIGEVEQPRSKAKRKLQLEHTCGAPVARPKGRRI